MGGTNKALLALGGRPVLAHVLAAVGAARCCRERIVVMNDADRRRLADDWHTTAEALGADHVVAGGAERWLSSRLGCAAGDGRSALLLVHDAARALVTPELIDAVAAAAREDGAALAARPVADTLKREGAGGRVAATVPRHGLWAAQTPQGARREHLLEAFERWDVERLGLPTDEASLLEAAGHAPRLVPAPARNFKLTTPDDLDMAEALLASTPA